MLVALDMTLAAECDRCRVLSPVDGLREQVSCRSCDSPVDVSGCLGDTFPGGVTNIFDDHDPVLEALVQGPGHELQRTGARARAQLVLATAELTCRACGSVLEAPAHGGSTLGPVTGPPTLACSCGATLPVRWPDASTRGWDRRLLCVVGETPVHGANRRVSGLVIPCGGCGAPLSGIANGRTVTCEHCNASNVVPDTAWMHLAAVAPTPFTLLYEVDHAMEARILEHIDPDDARWRHEPAKSWLAEQLRLIAPVHVARVRGGEATSDFAAARELAAHDLTAAEAAHVDNGLTIKQRRMLASGPVCAALVERWAQATDAATRAVAAHIAEPARFLDDPAAEVRAVVAKRQALTSDAMAKLALDGASAVRAAIAGRHDISVDVLKKLRHDGDPRVAEAAKANLAHHPSLFERLFDR